LQVPWHSSIVTDDRPDGRKLSSELEVAIALAENNQSFIDISDFDGSKGGEDRSEQSNVIIGKNNHREKPHKGVTQIS
jgi:hypothetical protein